MSGYILKRLLQIIVTLFIFHALLFFLIALQPGQAVPGELPPGATPEQIKKQKEYFGLDEPLQTRYLKSLKNVLTGNLGFSYKRDSTPVIDIIKERLPRTLLLFGTATSISFYLGFTLGKFIAWKRGSFAEQTLTIGGVTLFTLFTPLFALGLMWVFAFRFGWFPVGRFIDPVIWTSASVGANQIFSWMLVTVGTVIAVISLSVLLSRRLRVRRTKLVAFLVTFASIGLTIGAWSLSGVGPLALDIVRHMILPVATLTLVSFAGTMLLTRNSMLDSMKEDYVMAARAKGLSEKQVRDRHAARNALLPVVTTFVFSLAFAIDGGVIIESVFSWPGMGMTLVDSVRDKDIPLAIGTFGFIGVFALLAHLAADILYTYLDPRIRYS